MSTSRNTDFIKYLPFNDTDTLWQLYCTTLGFREIPPGTIYPPGKKKHPPEYRSVGTSGRVLNEFQIVYLSGGRGKLRMRQGEYPLSAGMAFLVFPGVWHWYASDLETGWDEYWVGFKGRYAQTLLENGILSTDRPVIEVGISSTITHLFHEMFETAEREPPGFQPKLAGSVIRLLAYSLSYASQQSHGDETERIVQQARISMENHLFDNLDMEELSGQLEISYTHFRTLFKNYTGQSPYQYYLNMKINKAKEMLETGELSVKEVALDLAFENQYYFSRLFKKKTGVSPSCWYRECIEQL
ncbi:MAG: AraC family transcriptional regulator [Spirochaetia bacterium]